jgi:hypothetical protein
MHNRKSVWRGVEEERDRLTKILDEVKAAGIWLTDPPARERIPSFIATDPASIDEIELVHARTRRSQP